MLLQRYRLHFYHPACWRIFLRKTAREVQCLTSCAPAATGVLGQQEAVSQGLLLQQAALALQMQGPSTLFGGEQPPPDASTQVLHAALRQQHYGTSWSAEGI